MPNSDSKKRKAPSTKTNPPAKKKRAPPKRTERTLFAKKDETHKIDKIIVSRNEDLTILNKGGTLIIKELEIKGGTVTVSMKGPGEVRIEKETIQAGKIINKF